MIEVEGGVIMDKEKLIYSILKELDQGNEPKFSDYGIDKDLFGSTVEIMQNDNLISGANVIRGGIGNKVVMTILSSARVEIKGLSYLEENSTWAKAYKGIKEVVDFIKP